MQRNYLRDVVSINPSDPCQGGDTCQARRLCRVSKVKPTTSKLQQRESAPAASGPLSGKRHLRSRRLRSSRLCSAYGWRLMGCWTKREEDARTSLESSQSCCRARYVCRSFLSYFYRRRDPRIYNCEGKSRQISIWSFTRILSFNRTRVNGRLCERSNKRSYVSPK